MMPDSLSPVANHLWQSSLFAVAAGLLTVALRHNPARVRHWIWVAASVKFLVPFSVLIGVGSRVQWRAIDVATMPTLSAAVEQLAHPFASPATALTAATVRSDASVLPAILWAVWACGFLSISWSWWIRWNRIRAAVRAGSPLPLDLPIKAISSPSILEPGVFGVFRPVLMLPDGICAHLTPEQWKPIVAHELCHVRHRDNLIAFVHMFVETVFWFHPLVWWLGKRIVQEREKACDEEVLRLGNEPRPYAQGILKVCERYLETPLTCVAGVSSSNLQRRIAGIMTNRRTLDLNPARQAALALAGLAAITLPLAAGMVTAPHRRAPSHVLPGLEVTSIKAIVMPPRHVARGRSGDTGVSPSITQDGRDHRPVINTVQAAVARPPASSRSASSSSSSRSSSSSSGSSSSASSSSSSSSSSSRSSIPAFEVVSITQTFTRHSS